MKVVILAGGFGTRISEESHRETKAYDRNREKTDSLAYYEDVFHLWI